MGDVKTNTLLKCGCCGDTFQTWEDYKDQAQDKGYGICQPCQDDIQKRLEADLDVAARVVEQSLNAENTAKFQAMTPRERRIVAAKLIQEGTLKMSFGHVGN